MKKSHYAGLEQLSTETLRSILRAYTLSDAEFNDELISYILTVLDERTSPDPEDRKKETRHAWQKFRQVYLPMAEKGQVRYPVAEADEATMEAALHQTGKRPGRKPKRLLAATAVAAVILSHAMPVALGYENLFHMAGVWNEDTFGFSKVSGISDPSSGPDSLRQALLEQGITAQVVPAWIPEGFAQEQISIQYYDEPERLSAWYSSQKDFLLFHYSLCADLNQTRVYEKTSAQVETYTVKGVTHYIFENIGETVIVWLSEDVECSIHGSFTREDAKRMVDSIYQ